MSGFIQRGAKQILQKQPHDVVILSALRTPVTKAYRGGLKDAYDHELLYHVRLPFPAPSLQIPIIPTPPTTNYN